MAQSIEPARQALIDALPTSGRVTYEELRVKLLSAGQVKALNRIHEMRRDGQIKAEVETGADGQPVLYVSRA